MTETLISSASDFPRTSVFERAGPNGNVYTVAFDNKEFGGWRQGLTAIAGIVVLVLFIPGMIWFGQAAEAVGISWIVGVAVVVVVFAGLFVRAKMPWTIKRAIELDFGADQLRIFKGKKITISRQLSRLANLTVENHPDAEHARITRQEEGQKSPKDVEKQHCLIGWFGAGGAEQVMLVSRAEWPDRQSLFEVRQAIMWAIEQAPSRNAAAPGPAPASPQTIKPPLD